MDEILNNSESSALSSQNTTLSFRRVYNLSDNLEWFCFNNTNFNTGVLCLRKPTASRVFLDNRKRYDVEEHEKLLYN